MYKYIVHFLKKQHLNLTTQYKTHKIKIFLGHTIKFTITSAPIRHKIIIMTMDVEYTWIL